ncbi:MoaD/ThiS family protein [Allomuricauda sp. M10]|uniref:MoaD/ThiS family protein n=1 Tax=Allomuricauda sp. M10 TaxID=2683292 RepID=UPI001D1931CF|nr:MoaD/ThiS family protein [Muricauda sp. M10]
MTILLYGTAKEIVGSPTLSVPTSNITGKPLPKTVGELKIFLGNTYPALKKLTSLAVAVNHNYAKDHEFINSYDEIALIPPPEMVWM